MSEAEGVPPQGAVTGPGITIPTPVDVTKPNAGIAGLQLPHVEKNKVLMSPGVWNNFMYSRDEITKAYKNTDWNDRYTTSIYYDHEDEKAGEWIGEVRNILYDEKTGFLTGDLYYFDLNTAYKLAFGKPKSGISPKVEGTDERGNMKDFVFRNFSHVINPAVKTAYVNNADGSAPIYNEEWSTAFVNDLPDSSFAYIEPNGAKDGEGKTTPRSLRHLPYKDASGGIDLPHVRNALARLAGTHIPESVKAGIRSKLESALGSTKNSDETLAKQFSPEETKAIGDGLGLDWVKYSPEEFHAGMNEELEHSDVTGGDPQLTAKIALTHLNEDPQYYSKLAKAFPKNPVNENQEVSLMTNESKVATEMQTLPSSVPPMPSHLPDAPAAPVPPVPALEPVKESHEAEPGVEKTQQMSHADVVSAIMKMLCDNGYVLPKPVAEGPAPEGPKPPAPFPKGTEEKPKEPDEDDEKKMEGLSQTIQTMSQKIGELETLLRTTPEKKTVVTNSFQGYEGDADQGFLNYLTKNLKD